MLVYFLNKQGVQTDHTRVYRTFGKAPKYRPIETRNVQISKITYLGIRKSKKNNSWKVMEPELPSKLGHPITVVGYTWGTGIADFEVQGDNTIAFQHATLVVKSGDKFPTAYIKVELKMEGMCGCKVKCTLCQSGRL